MIETVAPREWKELGFLVVRSYPWQDRAYAQANPDWLAGHGITRRVYFESERASLSDEVAARWVDDVEDATWFVHEHDAVALALIIDGRVLPTQMAMTNAGWGR